MESNKKNVFSQLNNERCGKLKSSLHGSLAGISFTSNRLKRLDAPFVLRYNFRLSLTKRSKKITVTFSKTLHFFFSIKTSNSVDITALVNAH